LGRLFHDLQKVAGGCGLLFFSFQEEKGFWQVYFLHGGFANNNPTIASQDLMIQCLDNDMSLVLFSNSSFFGPHAFQSHGC
jgi:hypothetical protein